MFTILTNSMGRHDWHQVKSPEKVSKLIEDLTSGKTALDSDDILIINTSDESLIMSAKEFKEFNDKGELT